MSGIREHAATLSKSQEDRVTVFLGGATMTPQDVIRAAWQDMKVAINSRRPPQHGVPWAESMIEMVYRQQSVAIIKSLNGKLKLDCEFVPESYAILRATPSADIQCWVSCMNRRITAPNNTLLRTEFPTQC